MDNRDNIDDTKARNVDKIEIIMQILYCRTSFQGIVFQLSLWLFQPLWNSMWNSI